MLCRDDKYCCLGVLCDLAVKAGVVKSVLVSQDGVYYDDHDTLPPPSVADWAGIKVGGGMMGSLNPTVTLTDGCLDNLANLNDRGHGDSGPLTFGMIADLIEAQL